MKPKYSNGVKLCYMDTDNFVMSFKTNDFYNDFLMMLRRDLILQIMK